MWTLTSEQRTALSSKGFPASVLELPAFLRWRCSSSKTKACNFLGIDFLPLIAVLEPVALSQNPGSPVSEDDHIHCALAAQ